jgi:multiple sugar transport system permease protein
MKRRHGLLRRLDHAQAYVILTVVSAILAAPFIFMFSIALSSDDTTQKMTFTFVPTEFHFENFVRVFTSDLPMGHFVLNSVLIVAFTCVGMTLTSAMVAFGFARLNAPGKNAIFVLVLSTMMIPGEVLLIPQFILFNHLGWLDTLLPLIVPQMFANAYNVFLMRQFISRIPTDLDEAAMVDGLGPFGVFRKIVFPLMVPVLAAVAILTFAYNWGEFMSPLIYISTPENMPLALGIQALSARSSGAQTPLWNMVMVGSVIMTIPMLIVYHFGQRYLYESGLTSGSVGVK